MEAVGEDLFSSSFRCWQDISFSQFESVFLLLIRCRLVLAPIGLSESLQIIFVSQNHYEVLDPSYVVISLTFSSAFSSALKTKVIKIECIWTIKDHFPLILTLITSVILHLPYEITYSRIWGN